MVRYITLLRFTEQGTKDMKKSTARASAFREAAHAPAGVAERVDFRRHDKRMARRTRFAVAGHDRDGKERRRVRAA